MFLRLAKMIVYVAIFVGGAVFAYEPAEHKVIW